MHVGYNTASLLRVVTAKGTAFKNSITLTVSSWMTMTPCLLLTGGITASWLGRRVTMRITQLQVVKDREMGYTN
jgi:hypothetical protein